MRLFLRAELGLADAKGRTRHTSNARQSRTQVLTFFPWCCCWVGTTGAEADGWSDLPPTETVACSGMARAAEWLHREVRRTRIAQSNAVGTVFGQVPPSAP